MDALEKADLLADNARTLAYTYLGPELSWAIYKNGTIGRAKEDLERAAKALDIKLKGRKNASKASGAWVSVNKALVTRASAVIPIIPLYISSLFRVMKNKGLHEGCVEQITRLFRERLYGKEVSSAAEDAEKVPADNDGRIRIDDWEMRPEVQVETEALMASIDETNLFERADVAGFKADFMQAHGFEVEGIDYEKEVDPSGLGIN